MGDRHSQLETRDQVLRVSKFLKEEIDLLPDKSKLHLYVPDVWQEFLRQNKMDNMATGIYSPVDLTAHLDLGSEFFKTNLVHELFGHGIFCEHSLVGMKMVFMERKIASLEKELGYDKNICKESEAYVSRQYNSFEGFALWLEGFCAKNLGYQDLFIQKLTTLPKMINRIYESIQDFQQQNGNMVFLYQLGFPKYYSSKDVFEIIRSLYKDKFGNIQLIILYGSRKPYSDIDLFVVGESIGGFPWLDVYAVSSESLSEGISKFDLAIIDPIFTGEPIYDPQGLLPKLKMAVNSQPITKEAIYHNHKMSEMQATIAAQYTEGSIMQQRARYFSKTYRQNAKMLAIGMKCLRLQELIYDV